MTATLESGAAALLVGMPDLDPLLKAEDVAKIIDMTPDYVYALVRSDEIPHLRFGRTLRFRESAIDEWLAERERASLTRAK